MKRSGGHILIRITLLFLLFFGVFSVGLMYFISRFDLDDYRHTLERQLSSALQQPVSIESSALTFDRGLAFEFRQVTIGDDDRELLISLPRLTTTVQLSSLWGGELQIEDLELHQPQVHLRLPLTTTSEPQMPQSSALISGFAVDKLIIKQGEISIYSESQSIQISNLHASVQNWRPDATAEAIISGTSPQLGADFILETRIPSDFSLQDWRAADLQAQLQITGATLPTLKHLQSQNFGNIDITIAGQPGQGADITFAARQSGSAEEVLRAEAVWQSQPASETLTTSSAQLFGLAAQLQFAFDHDQRQVTGQILSQQQLIERKTLSRIISIPQTFPKTVRLDKFQLGITHHLAQATESPNITGHVAFSNFTWDAATLWPATSFVGDFKLIANELEITDGQIMTTSEPITVAGTVKQPFSAPVFDLTATTQPARELFRNYFTIPDDWQLQGSVPLRLHLQGSADDPEFDLQLNATDSQFQLGSLYCKKANQKAELSARGTIDRDRILIETARLDLPLLKLTVSAEVTLDPENLHASIASEPIDLQTITTLHPALERYRLHGSARLDLDWTPEHWQGVLSVEKAGAHLTPLIGDLNSVSGTARLNATGLDFDQLPAHLGTSSFIVSGSLRNWSAPFLRLTAEAPEVRASDLIFFNPERTLHQVKGQLEIDRHGIRFDSVNLQVENETTATVHGSLNSFSNPQVELEITGNQVNVLDIISLFNRPSGSEPALTREGNLDYHPIIIHATAHKGTLGGLKFTNARATITEHQGILSIYPLTFENGDGWSRAKVEYIDRHPTAPLKISGHVNGIDASALHQDLLSKPGLIRGALTGDFYLEGDPADGTFWHHATGGTYFQVQDGTLRKFRGLAQVFSLLNVSQVFTGNLPDMDREGMPFDLLEGSAQINAGLVYTDDLKISGEAMNLSLVGTRDLNNDTTNMILAVMPLRTIDKVVSSIPIAGWVLGGEDRALLTGYFKIEGSSENPTVTAIPVGTLSGAVGGIFRRTLGLPEKLLRDFGSLFDSEPEKKEDIDQ